MRCVRVNTPRYFVRTGFDAKNDFWRRNHLTFPRRTRPAETEPHVRERTTLPTEQRTKNTYISFAGLPEFRTAMSLRQQRCTNIHTVEDAAQIADTSSRDWYFKTFDPITGLRTPQSCGAGTTFRGSRTSTLHVPVAGRGVKKRKKNAPRALDKRPHCPRPTKLVDARPPGDW